MNRTRYAFVFFRSHPLTPAPVFGSFRYLWSMCHSYITQTAQEFVWKRTETHLFRGVSVHTFSYKPNEFVLIKSNLPSVNTLKNKFRMKQEKLLEFLNKITRHATIAEIL